MSLLGVIPLSCGNDLCFIYTHEANTVLRKQAVSSFVWSSTSSGLSRLLTGGAEPHLGITRISIEWATADRSTHAGERSERVKPVSAQVFMATWERTTALEKDQLGKVIRGKRQLMESELRTHTACTSAYACVPRVQCRCYDGGTCDSRCDGEKTLGRSSGRAVLPAGRPQGRGALNGVFCTQFYTKSLKKGVSECY